MKEKRCVQKSKTKDRFFLNDICGTWVSGFGSPELKIFKEGKRFRLTLKYMLDATFTFTLKQNQEHAFFHFFGFILIAYDQEKDLLNLSSEGDYLRAYEA